MLNLSQGESGKEAEGVLKMEVIDQIREMNGQGVSQRKIATALRVDRKTVKRMIEREDFEVQPAQAQKRGSRLDRFKSEIDSWLEEDKKTWPKQKHTAQRIWDRLDEKYGEEFGLSYSTVQRYVKGKREELGAAKARLELIWEAGDAQVDFGQVEVTEKGESSRLHYLVVSFPYSNAGYLQLFRGENAECVVQGLQDIFAYLGGTPNLLVFDNASGVGRRQGDKVSYSELFLRFKNHYGCAVRFCNPASGHEKGHVENKVGYLRRNLFVPVPEISDIETANRELLRRCEQLMKREHYKHGGMIAERHEQDKARLKALPRLPFTAARLERRKADGYGKISLEGLHYYSAGPEQAHRPIIVEVGAHEVRLYDGQGQQLCKHARVYGDKRSDSTDAAMILGQLSKAPGAYHNSLWRQSLTETLREHLDGLQRPQLKAGLKLIEELRKQYDYPTAIEAAEAAVRHGKGLKSETLLLAARIAHHGLDATAEDGPDLSSYDRLLLGAGDKHE